MKRVGCLVPYTNYVVEQEVQYLFEKGFLSTTDICFHFAKLTTETRYSVDEYKYLKQINESREATLERLSPLELDTFAFFCTSAGILKDSLDGWNINAINSLRNACQFVGMSKCMLITPYTKNIGWGVAGQIEECGIEITHFEHLNLRNSEDYVSYGYSDLYTFILENYKKEYGDIVISCTNFPTFHLIEKIETDLNTTVITSNQSIIWEILSSLHISHAQYGIGSLLRR